MADKFILEIEEDEDWGNDEYATVVRVDGENKTEIGSIGGEPEDNTYYRTYCWVVDALNDAYKQGLKDGAKREYDRLRDKI